MSYTRRHPTKAFLLAARAVAVALSFGCGRASPDSADADLLNELSADLGTRRIVEARLSIATDYAPCNRLQADSSSSCAALSVRDGASRWLTRSVEAVRERPTPVAVHAAGLVDLLYGGGQGNAIDRSIKSLKHGVGAEESSVALVDLSAALIGRGTLRNSLRDYLEAAESATEAVKRDPRNAAALFNLALALHKLGLEEQVRLTVRTLSALDRNRAGHARRTAGSDALIPRCSNRAGAA